MYQGLYNYSLLFTRYLLLVTRYSLPSPQILVPRTSWGRPLKILFDSPADVPIWRPRDVLKWRPGDVLIWRSRDVPGRLIRDVPRTFSGRPLEDLESTQTWMSKFFFNFSFRTYSIDQIKKHFNIQGVLRIQ